MSTIRKDDMVTLPDNSIGKVLEVYGSEGKHSFKIKRLDNNDIQYFDESKISLRRRHFKNLLAVFIKR